MASDERDQEPGAVERGGSGELPTPPAAVPHALAQFIENQRQELIVRAHEAEIQKLNSDNERLRIEKAHEYAMKAVDLQAQDRREERDADGKGIRQVLLVVCLVIIGVLVFFGYALYSNKEQLILEILRIIVYAGGGGGFGFAIGRSRREEESRTSGKASQD